MLFPRSECCVIDSFFLAASFSFMFYQKCPTSQAHSLSECPAYIFQACFFLKQSLQTPLSPQLLAQENKFPLLGVYTKGNLS